MRIRTREQMKSNHIETVDRVKYSLLTVLFAFLCFGIASGKDVSLRKDGDRVLLYEFSSAAHLRFLATDFNAWFDQKQISKEELTNAIEADRIQAALFAFMFFIDQTRIHKGAEQDKVGRAIVDSTKKLMKRVDWNNFEKFVRSDGRDLIAFYLEDYTLEMFNSDFRDFKKAMGG